MEPQVQAQPSGSAEDCSALVAAVHSPQRLRAMLACSPASVQESLAPLELLVVRVQLVWRLPAWVLVSQALAPRLGVQEQQPELPASPARPCAAVRVPRVKFPWPVQC